MAKAWAFNGQFPVLVAEIYDISNYELALSSRKIKMCV